MQRPADKTSISIEQIRDLIGRLEYRALEAAVKFAVVQNADLMQEAAANALLKTLEEPRPGTVLILTTAVPQALLLTIRSRCQMVAFPVMSNSRLAVVLKNAHDLASDDAAVLAAFGEGSPGRALALGEEFMDRRRALLDALWGSADVEAFVKLAGTDRAAAREALKVLLMACRDALFIKAGAPAAVINRDRQLEIRRWAERTTAPQLAAQADRVSDAIRRIDGNQNVKVVLTVVREFIQ